KGVIGTGTKEEDIVTDIFITSNHHSLLFFTNKGRVHWLKAYELPERGRTAQGKSLVNILHLGEGEKVSTLLPVASFTLGNLFFVTKKGTVKRTRLEEFSNPRRGGIVALNLREQDELITVLHTSGNQEILLASKEGQAVRFNEEKVSIVGRQAAGVRGMHVLENDAVVGAEAVIPGTSLLTVTEQGYGKRTLIDEYRLTNRGGTGVTNIKITEKNGKVAGVLSVTDADEILCMTKQGQAIRIPAKEISVIGRNTQGVRIMRLDEHDKVNAVAKVGGKE
ncbi:MAG: DNA gyrase C-terminal beta-propeller domain-containing protein, partial [Nanoarchaeota archaeon]